MKYLIYQTEQKAREAQQNIYAQFLRNRASENNGKLDDWSNSPIKPVSIELITNENLQGNRFPLYGKRANDYVFITEFGHTTAWATPRQISDGRWVIVSPDETGVDAQPDWWPILVS